MPDVSLPQRQAPDWAAETNQYDLRLRWPDGRRETRMIMGRPRLGPDAETEFRANWAGLDESAPDSAYPAVLSITDVALQVTFYFLIFLPSSRGTKVVQRKGIKIAGKTDYSTKLKEIIISNNKVHKSINFLEFYAFMYLIS